MFNMFVDKYINREWLDQFACFFFNVHNISNEVFMVRKIGEVLKGLFYMVPIDCILLYGT